MNMNIRCIKLWEKYAYHGSTSRRDKDKIAKSGID